jgi:hypothetical protein
MDGYTKVNLRRDVENQAPRFDMPDELEARFARTPIEGETLGLSLMTLDPGFRIPFGHKHPIRKRSTSSSAARADQGRGRDRRAGEWDAIRIDKDTMRNMEAGPTGSSSSPSAPATTRRTRR